MKLGRELATGFAEDEQPPVDVEAGPPRGADAKAPEVPAPEPEPAAVG